MTDIRPYDAWADRLSDYLDDELDPPERAGMDDHLRGCAECRMTLDQLRAVTARASALRDRDPGPQVWAAIAERTGLEGISPGGGVDELAARRAAKRVRFPWMQTGIAAAAVLALGIGIGRRMPGPDRLPPMVVQSPAEKRSHAAYSEAVAQHMGRTEALLTSFRAEAAGGQVDPQVAEWAAQMLSNTRLLLDSPAANDPKLRTLLQDMELVLAQIAALPRKTDANTTEVDLARRAVEEKHLLPRMQTLAPAGRSATLGES